MLKKFKAPKKIKIMDATCAKRERVVSWKFINNFVFNYETVNPIWTGGGGGGKMAPLRVFAKYLSNGLTDLHQTF